MQMKNVLAVTFIIATITATMSGCVSNQPPATSPTPMAPSATPGPTQWPPSTIGIVTSSQVVASDVKVSYNRDVNSAQSENFSILITNNGRTWANNTFITLKVTDAQTDEFYYTSPQFDLGNIPPRSSKWLNVSTGSHDFGFSVLVQMEWFWGDNLEFRNTFKKAYSLAPVDTKEK
jgi:hypothetical protein